MQRAYGNDCPCGFPVTEMTRIDFVEGFPVVHANQVNRHFDHVFQACSGRCQNGADVVQRLLGLLFER